MSAAKPKESPDLGAIFDGHIEKKFGQYKEGGMTDRKTIDSHLTETVGPNHEDEIATGTQKNKRVGLRNSRSSADTQALAAAHDLSTHHAGMLRHKDRQ
jgi:hypothetical protein